MTGTCHNNIPVHITKRQVNMAKSEYLWQEHVTISYQCMSPKDKWIWQRASMTGTCHNNIPVHVTKRQVNMAKSEYDRDMSQLHTSTCHQKTSEYGKERVWQGHVTITYQYMSPKDKWIWQRASMTGTCHNNIPVHVTKRQVNMAKSEYDRDMSQ